MDSDDDFLLKKAVTKHNAVKLIRSVLDKNHNNYNNNLNDNVK